MVSAPFDCTETSRRSLGPPSPARGEGALRLPQQRCSSRLLILPHIRTPAFGERTERLVAGDGGLIFVEVPFALGFLRLLDPHQIHVVHHAAVLADHAALREEIIHRDFAHLTY